MSFLDNFFNQQQPETAANWIHLTIPEQLEEIVKQSAGKPVLIFKHSTRCGISVSAKSRLEAMSIDNEKVGFYYLDLLSFRTISDQIAQRFDVIHQSPQLILIKEGVAVKHTSHHAISAALLHQWLTE